MKNVTIIEFSLSLRVPFCACRAALHVLFYAGAQAKNTDVALVSELVALTVRTSYGHWYSNIQQLPPHISVGVWHLARRARKQKKNKRRVFSLLIYIFYIRPVLRAHKCVVFLFYLVDDFVSPAQMKSSGTERREIGGDDSWCLCVCVAQMEISSYPLVVCWEKKNRGRDLLLTTWPILAVCCACKQHEKNGRTKIV